MKNSSWWSSRRTSSFVLTGSLAAKIPLYGLYIVVSKHRESCQKETPKYRSYLGHYIFPKLCLSTDDLLLSTGDVRFAKTRRLTFRETIFCVYLSTGYSVSVDRLQCICRQAIVYLSTGYSVSVDRCTIHLLTAHYSSVDSYLFQQLVL
ncbi:hypothetical protein Taro_003564 [Colocasia esculenta]|uniref:Uncharacterized protein n=1 Tax=Colocasia esculenta TaxID=4460 RepID=A0A843THG1_COLES|nr:hypothetical protein [Colocasia esculenta]